MASSRSVQRFLFLLCQAGYKSPRSSLSFPILISSSRMMEIMHNVPEAGRNLQNELMLQTVFISWLEPCNWPVLLTSTNEWQFNISSFLPKCMAHSGLLQSYSLTSRALWQGKSSLKTKTYKNTFYTRKM